MWTNFLDITGLLFGKKQTENNDVFITPSRKSIKVSPCEDLQKKVDCHLAVTYSKKNGQFIMSVRREGSSSPPNITRKNSVEGVTDLIRLLQSDTICIDKKSRMKPSPINFS